MGLARLLLGEPLRGELAQLVLYMHPVVLSDPVE